MKRRGGTPEQIVKRAISEYLDTIPDILFWWNDSKGTWDPIRHLYRKNLGRWQLNGVADILGVYKGRAFAIEVKAILNKKGASDTQKAFLSRFSEAGGACCVARSIEDVIQMFEDEFP